MAALTHEDRVNEFRALYALSTEPHRTSQTTAQAQAVSFAQLLIQSFILLHGGALVAFPTLFQAIGVDLKSNIILVLTLGIALAGGLFAAALAGICGFFAMANGADGAMLMIDVGGKEAYMQAFDVSEYAESVERDKQGAVEQEAKADRHFRKYQIWRYWGIGSIIASLVAFVAGAGISFCAILTIAPS